MLDFDALVLAPAMATFGESVTYLPADGPPLVLAGASGAVFNDRFTDSKFDGGAEVISIRPVVNVRTAALPKVPTQGELFRIRGILYQVADPPEPDGMGDLRIYLRLASDAQAALAPLPPS